MKKFTIVLTRRFESNVVFFRFLNKYKYFNEKIKSINKYIKEN